MRQKCIDAVQLAAGRTLTQAEIKGIEARINRNMRQLAQKDPQWKTLSDAQRLDAAAQAAVKELTHEAAQQKFRLQRQIIAMNKLQSETGGWSGGRMDAIKRKMVSITDGKGSFRSIETLTNAIKTDALRRLEDVFESLDPRMFGLLENDEGVTAFVNALYGKTTGIDPKVVKAAQAWLDTANGLREQFNNVGGKVGKLEDWVLPQHHSQLKIAKAGVDQWVSDILPLLDRAKYVDEAGARLSDSQVGDFLRNAWLTISTNGINKIEPGRPHGTGMRANNHSQHREIHFSGPDAFLAYGKKYGDQPLLQTMVSHIGSMAKDIAMVEEFGPNPNRMYEYLRDQSLKEAVIADPKREGYYREQSVKLDNLWRFTAGQEQPVAREWLARSGDALRNFLVSTRLGSAVISSIADEGTMAITAKINGLSYMQMFGNELRAMNLANGEELRQARRAGLALDTAIGDLNRFGNDNFGTTVSSKLAHMTMRVSGMNAITDVRRRAFGVTMMDSIGHLTRNVNSLSSLDAHDNRILLSKGVTDTDWQVWRAANPENWGGNHTVLTPDSIYAIPDADIAHLGNPDAIRRDAALKLIGAVSEEIDMAVITPKALEREMFGGGLQRGTWKGELARSFFLFKTTPLAVVIRHWSRALSQDTFVGKAGYISAMVATTTLLGAFTLQIKELIAGRDPRNLNPFEDHGVKNWIQAFLNGGSFGLYGDFLFSGTTRHESSPLGAMLGPVASLTEQMFNLTQGNLVQALQGSDTKFGAELIRFGRQNIPLANVWYTKAALDHLIFNDLQEMASPGFMAQTKRRMQKEFGQSFYWDPATDELRAPDFERVVGN